MPEPLAGHQTVDLGTTLLGRPVRAPFFIAPTAYQRTIHRAGECATARAASELGILGVYSTLASDRIEAIAAASGQTPWWFQLYLQPQLSTSLALVRRAEQAGGSAIVVTVDAPVLGSRDRQNRSVFAVGKPLPIGAGPSVVTPPRGPAWVGGTYSLHGAAEVSWSALKAVRESTSLPLVVKGILDPVSARRALEIGANAIVVSNHGGRQLDLAPATLDVLPEIVSSVGRRAEVYLDGGVRRGSDVAVALALGARAVGIGRPVLWALAAGGRAGVGRYLRLLGTELANSLLLLGCASVKTLDRAKVRPAVTVPPVAEPTGSTRGRR